MPQEIQDRPLACNRFSHETFTVLDYICPGSPCVCHEEVASAYEIVLPRNGVYVRRNHYEEVFADLTKIIFFDFDDPYEIGHPIKQQDTCTVISLNPVYCEKFGLVNQENGDLGFGVGSAIIDYQTAIRHIRLIKLLDTADADSVFEIEENVMLLIDYVLSLRFDNDKFGPQEQCQEGDSTIERNKNQVQKTLEFLNQHFFNRINLDIIANNVGCSIFHLCRIFKRQTNKTISQYLRELRLQKALNLLSDTRGSITSVSHDLGYSSHSHFSAQFKSAFGVTPSEYRCQVN